MGGDGAVPLAQGELGAVLAAVGGGGVQSIAGRGAGVVRGVVADLGPAKQSSVAAEGRLHLAVACAGGGALRTDEAQGELLPCQRAVLIGAGRVDGIAFNLVGKAVPVGAVMGVDGGVGGEGIVPVNQRAALGLGVPAVEGQGFLGGSAQLDGIDIREDHTTGGIGVGGLHLVVVVVVVHLHHAAVQVQIHGEAVDHQRPHGRTVDLIRREGNGVLHGFLALQIQIVGGGDQILLDQLSAVGVHELHHGDAQLCAQSGVVADAGGDGVAAVGVLEHDVAGGELTVVLA